MIRCPRRVRLECRHQHLHVEDVDAHRSQDRLSGGHVARLLEEARQAIVFVDLQHAEPAGLLGGNLEDGERRTGTPFLVEVEHLRVVHLVDVVAREHDQVPRLLAQDGIQVLVDGVGGAEVPVLADPLLRAENLDELPELVRHDAPSHPQVPAERQGLVLKRDEDLPEPGVDAVAQGEVDDPVRPSEVDSGLGPLLGERIQPFAHPARQYHHQSVVLHLILSVSAARTGRRSTDSGMPFSTSSA